MSVNSDLRKAGIDIIQQLNEKDVSAIASNIASKICLAFPEHNLKRHHLISAISNINMYIANMPEDYSQAKYFYKNNSIYFKKYSTPEEMSNVAVHECIHFIQEITDENYNLVRMGLYKVNSGLAINEAAVQLMTAEANNFDVCEEKYYGINLKTTSPDYYPLQCALVNQMAYFTGTYPLYHSTLNSNDIFENTFSLKADKKTYEKISKYLDTLLYLENDLTFYIQELRNTDKVRTMKSLNNIITKRKEEIRSVFFKAQNLIIKKCFEKSFTCIRNLEEIKEFQQDLYKFKNIMGYTDNYTFYNDFYCNIMNSLAEKRNYIIKNGDINLFDKDSRALSLINTTKDSYSFAKVFMFKLKKLFRVNVNGEDINYL